MILKNYASFMLQLVNVLDRIVNGVILQIKQKLRNGKKKGCVSAKK